MGWVKIDDGFFDHHKVIDLSDKAKLTFLAGLCHCNKNMTDGFVSAAAARFIVGGLGAPKKVTNELVDVGLWHKRADGFDVHDYLEYQPTAEQERKRRADTKERVRNMRQRRRNPPGNAVTTNVTNGVSNAGGNTPGNTARTTTPGPVPLVLPSPSDLHGWPPGDLETEDEKRKAIELTQWLWEVVGRSRQAKGTDVFAVVCWALGHLDAHVVEEAIGYLRELGDPPRTARYVATTVRSWASQRGVEMPEWGAEVGF